MAAYEKVLSPLVDQTLSYTVGDPAVTTPWVMDAVYERGVLCPESEYLSTVTYHMYANIDGITSWYSSTSEPFFKDRPN
jgi:hypothetical protein